MVSQCVDRILGRFLNLVNSSLDGLLCIARHLVCLSFVTKFVIANQRACGFLDSAFHDIRFGTHVGTLPFFLKYVNRFNQPRLSRKEQFGRSDNAF